MKEQENHANTEKEQVVAGTFKNDNKKGNNKVLILIVIVMAIGNIVLGWLYYTSIKKTDIVYIKLNDTNQEKESIQKQLDDIMVGYDALKIDNDTLSQKIEDQKKHILEMKDELKHNKKVSYYQIAQYKKELETLRKIMKSYIVQIDSLNTLNQNLITENTEVKSNYKFAQNKNEELSKKNQNLSEKVNIAKEIRVFNMNISSLNKRGKPNSKAKKIHKIQICFTLGQNKVVTPGTKTVFLRIARPDGSIISSTEYDLFDFEGNKIVYTSKREVDYQNADTDMCMYWTNESNEELLSGTYFADIFVEGKNIGTQTFSLK